MRGRFFNTRTTYWMMARVVHLEDRCMTRLDIAWESYSTLALVFWRVKETLSYYKIRERNL